MATGPNETVFAYTYSIHLDFEIQLLLCENQKALDLETHPSAEI